MAKQVEWANDEYNEERGTKFNEEGRTKQPITTTYKQKAKTLIEGFKVEFVLNIRT